VLEGEKLTRSFQTN